MKVKALKDGKLALDLHARRVVNVKVGDVIELAGRSLDLYLEHGYVEAAEEKAEPKVQVKLEEKELKKEKNTKELKKEKKTK